MELKKIFDSWAGTAKKDYARKQWLLSKWELFEGIEWTQEKKDLMVKSIANGLQLRKTHALLDLGCGGGWILKQLKPRVKKIYGLDFSQRMLAFALKVCPGEKFISGEISTLPFKDGSFDRALSYYVFLNFTDDRYVERSLMEILRVLKKGGRALIGQLPDKNRSRQYDLAKREHLAYCHEHFVLGKNIRDTFPPPLRLSDRVKLGRFLKDRKIKHRFLKSFNPFYRRGKPALIDWRFDLVLGK